jgi:UDP-galactopyranose mutase
MSWNFDVVIVGAGFSGLTVAERVIAEQGKRCLIIEKRSHLGGNAYDFYDDHGVLIHKYGPHYFRTNSGKVLEYLSRFTEWHPVDYKILSFTDGQFWNFPINLNTFEKFIGKPSTTEEMEAWIEAHRVKIETPANSEEVIISQVGWELYEKFFKGYTIKQWQREPKDLDASVCGRIPIRTNRDDRYLREDFQALPAAGYTLLFEKMVDACGAKLKIIFNSDFREVLPHISYKHLVYTGPIDEYFDCCFGSLPYRSLRFERESFTSQTLKGREGITGKKGFWQPAMQVNYPNTESYTRIVEIKHATGQTCENTTIVKEYPENFGPGKEPYYPIPASDTAAIYSKYKEKAAFEKNVSFIGRLATYRYYNMDQVVGMALKEAEKLNILLAA